MGIRNISRPGEDPVEGDWIEDTTGPGTLEHQFHGPIILTDEEIKENARNWRDRELAETDLAAQTPDYPNRDAYLTYRQELRDWPSTGDFPDTKPTLGS